jgi:hypothetical protein
MRRATADCTRAESLLLAAGSPRAREFRAVRPVRKSF